MVVIVHEGVTIENSLAFLFSIPYSAATLSKEIMPITKGAEKANRQSKRKRIFNIRRKNVMADTIKDVQKAVSAGDLAKAKELLPKAYQAIDKAAKRGVIKDNTAARKKSRLTARVKSAGTK